MTGDVAGQHERQDLLIYKLMTRALIGVNKIVPARPGLPLAGCHKLRIISLSVSDCLISLSNCLSYRDLLRDSSVSNNVFLTTQPHRTE